MRPNSLPLLALASGTTAQNVVQFELNRAFPDLRVGILPEGLSRRGFYTETAANNLTGGGYYTQVTVGGQQVPMVLDTGSSDAWVVSYKADLCTSAKLQAYYGDSCAATYNPSKSSNYQLVTTKGFSITYLDGGGAIGDYISDDFSIGGVTVKSMQLGYATSTSRGTGILGVGFSANEATSKKYPNLIDSLANQGLISTKAYSLYLNDRRSPSGNILLGGVDTNKFVGPLAVLPIMKSSGTTANYTSFAVALNGMSAKFSSGTTTNVPTTKSNLPAILDSGTTLSYLPDDMATSLFNAVGAYTETRSTGLAFVDCKYLYSSSESFTLEFTFGTDTKISVPVEELVLDVVSGSSSALGLPFDNACLFGIQSTGGFNTKRSDEYRRQTSTSTFALLGDTFLRSAYVVYDLSNAQIGIAPANLNSSDANVTELKGAASELAALTGVASQQTTATVMPTGTVGGGASGTGTGSGGQVTVTVTGGTTPKNNIAPRAMRAPSTEVFGIAAVSSLFAVLGGLLFAL